MDPMFPKAEAAARDLLIHAFNDDNIDSETYIKIHDLYTLVVQLNTPSKKTRIKRLFRK